MLGVKRMTPAWLQLPPRPAGASARICTGPPAAATVRNFPSEKKPTERLSADQNGNVAPSAPFSDQVLPVSRSRIQSLMAFPDWAAKASLVPSGEIATP